LGCTAWCFTVRKGCTGNKKHHTSQPGTTCEHCIRIVDSTALPPAVSQVTASFSKGRCILPINNQRSVSRKGSNIDVGFYIHMCCKTQNHMIYSSAQRAYAKKADPPDQSINILCQRALDTLWPRHTPTHNPERSDPIIAAAKCFECGHAACIRRACSMTLHAPTPGGTDTQQGPKSGWERIGAARRT
jgi:hypothetical protein